MQLVCKTERMSLVRLDPTSSELVLDYVNRNRAFLKEWEIERNELYYTNSHQADLLEKEVKLIEDGLLIKVWMLYEDRVIGSISLSNIVRGAFQSCHLGYRMDGSLVNRGLMTEGVQAIIDYAFEVVGLHRIEANIMPRNAASLRVVEKLGFYEEGLAFKYLKIHGVWEDHIHMVLRNTAME
ncbi:GNAT family N-acetyltransferase [Paenibacillus chondroitinus]|uniref:GNAT family N-acetyltransferase n=1 Tax=Paenibacillus chondroitinus TaxID=59842 RepID=A0ABU6D4L7_9BACL|nr:MULTISPECIES: GNAT family N-acetyltransferase [Paenibacillus]MCY9658329.1 GNAT family N-acetyltransferase [Paenibacillus anseongense]MEB4792672.1 GNAT family N-acetyltransferase [Paenibacillus chondroitinus]